MSALKPVPEALALGTDQMCIDVLEGDKEISVRTGHRDFTEGNTLVLYNEDFGFVVTATVTSIRHCKLSEVTEREWLDDGFSTQAQMLAGLQQFYGDSITWDSDVTVLQWSDVKGLQFDRYHAIRAEESG